MSFVLGILSVFFGFLNIKFKKFLIAICVSFATYLIFFGDDKFYSFVYYCFALGFTQLLITAYENFQIKEKK